MAMTLAALGPKPVVELHTAGLKVGEIVWRDGQGGSHTRTDFDDLVEFVSSNSSARPRPEAKVEASLRASTGRGPSGRN
jgi:hypothetical protein